MGKKKKPKSPRRKRMKRQARLQSAAHWMKSYPGKNVVRGYARCFGVDLGCALKELQILGVALDPEYVERLRTTLRNRTKPSKPKPKAMDTFFSEERYGIEWDDDFAMIAGRTPAGFAYGLTWEEYKAMEKDYDQTDISE